MNRVTEVLLLLFILNGCTTDTKITQDANPLSSGINTQFISTTIRPQDDFYHYANGRWLAEFELPGDKAYFGTSGMLREQIQSQIKTIISDVNEQAQQPGSAEQKIADLYRAYMDLDTIEARGLDSLATDLKRIDDISNVTDLSEYLGYADVFNRAPVGIFVYLDDKNSDEYIVFMDQSGLGLPDRDYYLNMDSHHEMIQEKYIAHVGQMLSLAGIQDSNSKAQAIYDLEHRLAQGHWDSVSNRDLEKTYNKMRFADLSALAPDLDWEVWLTHTMIDRPEYVVVLQPSYLETLNTAINVTPIDTWKDYFKWHLLSRYAEYLSEPFVLEDFAFYGTVLSGKTAQAPRWKRAVDLVNRKLGELVGRVYVKRHFPPEAKTRVLQMVENMRDVYAESIKNLAWMADSTKVKALEKLANLKVKIGYPEVWRDYSQLNIRGDDLVAMMKETTRFYVHRGRSKLGKPVDHTEWGMHPQTVNAYYDPSKNEVAFPAGFLQPPFFNVAADDAANYGGIGAIIGHEMGHAFDDVGAQYDSDGNRVNWWTAEDLQLYQERTKQLIAQYNAYTVFDGTHVNGELTQGENLSDLSGATIAYRAFKANSQDHTILDGFSPEQRFFIARAQVRMRKYRDEELLQQIKTNHHAPAEFRVNGVLRNMPEFYQAFDVQPGDGMYLSEQDRVAVW